jgi:hypothetical protein
MFRFEMGLFDNLRTALIIVFFWSFIYVLHVAIGNYLSEDVSVSISTTLSPTILPSFTFCPVDISNQLITNKMQSGQNTTFAEFVDQSINMRERIDVSVMWSEEYSSSAGYDLFKTVCLT